MIFAWERKDNIIYTDTENKKETYDIVKNFLIDEEIEIKLILTENLNDSNAKQLEIQMNFCSEKGLLEKSMEKLFLTKILKMN